MHPAALRCAPHPARLSRAHVRAAPSAPRPALPRRAPIGQESSFRRPIGRGPPGAANERRRAGGAQQAGSGRCAGRSRARSAQGAGRGCGTRSGAGRRCGAGHGTGRGWGSGTVRCAAVRGWGSGAGRCAVRCAAGGAGCGAGCCGSAPPGRCRCRPGAGRGSPVLPVPGGAARFRALRLGAAEPRSARGAPLPAGTAPQGSRLRSWLR